MSTLFFILKKFNVVADGEQIKINIDKFRMILLKQTKIPKNVFIIKMID